MHILLQTAGQVSSQDNQMGTDIGANEGGGRAKTKKN